MVPRLGLKRSCLYGVAVFAASQVATGFAPTPEAFFASIFLTSIGCACVPALLAFIANQVGHVIGSRRPCYAAPASFSNPTMPPLSQARPEERGAVIGAVGTVQELCGAIGFRCVRPLPELHSPAWYSYEDDAPSMNSTPSLPLFSLSLSFAAPTRDSSRTPSATTARWSSLA